MRHAKDAAAAAAQAVERVRLVDHAAATTERPEPANPISGDAHAEPQLAAALPAIDLLEEAPAAEQLMALESAAAEAEPAASPVEALIEPEAGGDSGDAGGSLLAASPYLEDGFGNLFGVHPRGPFEGLPQPTLEPTEEVLGPLEEGPEDLSSEESEAAGQQQPPPPPPPDPETETELLASVPSATPEIVVPEDLMVVA